MKITKRKLSIITLAATLALSLIMLFSLNAVKAANAEGTITVNGSSVFTATNGASVSASAVGEGDTAEYYSTFTFTSNDELISYRRNLAYFWYEEVPKLDEDGKATEDEKVLTEGKFNMEIGFKSTVFEKFVITFESQQYNKTKDAKSKNYVTFFPGSADGKVLVWITTEEDFKKEDIPEDKKVELNSGYIYIEFKDKYVDEAEFSGGYNVEVHDADETHGKLEGRFENAGGNYAKYSSSSTSPLYPLIFNAEFAENTENAKAEMVMYAFNGQRFKTSSATSNTVTDNVAPVLCLEEDLKYLELNGGLDFNYVVIDVLRTSLPTPTVYYYLLEYDQTTGDEVKDYNDKDLYKQTKKAGDVRLEADKGKYMPSEADLADTAFAASYVTEGGKLVPNNSKEKPVADMLIKVYLKLTDSSSNGTESEVSLDWYLDDGYKVTMTKGENEADFIAVAKDSLGATYNYGEGWQELKDAYQAKVTELAKNLSAGSSSYMYLPSPESLFSDNATSYTDMKFSIYYFHDSKQSSTNLSYNNLSINVTKEAKYTFTIYATDAAGNDMYYLDEVTDEAEKDIVIGDKYYKYVEFSSGDIWTMYDDKDNEGLRDRLPWFSFSVGYNGVEFEETPGMQSTAYVGTSYSFSGAFKINGVTGSYTTNYRLFRFNSAQYYKDNENKTFTYEEFIEKMDSLFDNPETHKYFEEIYQVSESDANYEEYKDYAWSNSSTSFVPQEANTFYYVLAEVKDTGYNADAVTCSLAISASEPAKTIKGESNWIQNNVASVVLLSIAVVALIGIVLLIVIKPKDKGDIDVQLEKSQNKKK